MEPCSVTLKRDQSNLAASPEQERQQEDLLRSMVLTTVGDRTKSMFEAVRPNVTAKILIQELKKGSILCIGVYRSYLVVLEGNGLIHKNLNVSSGIKVIDKVFHIQNQNTYHSILREWCGLFHGVAIKYLDYYLGRFRFMDGHENVSGNNFFRVQYQLMVT